MPFWWQANKDKYQQLLDDNSMLSVDAEYDPEAGLEIVNMESISRIIDYKAILVRFMKRSAYNFADKKKRLEEFQQLLIPVTIQKQSMIEVDKFL